MLEGERGSGQKQCMHTMTGPNETIFHGMIPYVLLSDV